MGSARRLSLGLALMAVLVVFAPVGAVANAAAATGSVPSSTNKCANPILASSSTGWAVTSGGSAARVAITDHVVAKYAVRLSATTTTAQIRLPQLTVIAGQQWRFAVDSRISSGGGSVRVGIRWYDSAGVQVGISDGALTTVGATTYNRVSHTAVAPTRAVRATVFATARLVAGSLWYSTACDFTPPPPPVDGVQAATQLGWGPVVDGDEFSGTVVDTAKWGLYDSVGHAGNGLRRPSQITVANGNLTITGLADGTTGGMAMRTGRLHGRWEARMQVPTGDAQYHPVLLLWPDAEDWPIGGEIDYAESTAASTTVDFFLHYGANNSQTQASRAVDLTQWHNYAVEWTPTAVRGFVDGVKFFEDTNPDHLPPRAMHQTIQLDWFPSGSTTRQSSMNVAWVRIYNLPA